MSAKNQNTQFLLMGLAAIAAAGVLYYLLQQESSLGTVKATKKKLADEDDLADDDTVQAKGGTSTSTASSSTAKTLKTTSKDSSATSSKSSAADRMDEKDLHAKIEELDKKGKAFFKNKQVGVSNVLIHIMYLTVLCGGSTEGTECRASINTCLLNSIMTHHSPSLLVYSFLYEICLVFGSRPGVYRGSHHD